jgi:hypothetical protein
MSENNPKRYDVASEDCDPPIPVPKEHANLFMIQQVSRGGGSGRMAEIANGLTNMLLAGQISGMVDEVENPVFGEPKLRMGDNTPGDVMPFVDAFLDHVHTLTKPKPQKKGKAEQAAAGVRDEGPDAGEAAADGNDEEDTPLVQRKAARKRASRPATPSLCKSLALYQLKKVKNFYRYLVPCDAQGNYVNEHTGQLMDAEEKHQMDNYLTNLMDRDKDTRTTEEKLRDQSETYTLKHRAKKRRMEGSDAGSPSTCPMEDA